MADSGVRLLDHRFGGDDDAQAVLDGRRGLNSVSTRGGGAEAGSICMLAAAIISTSIGFGRGLGTG